MLNANATSWRTTAMSPFFWESIEKNEVLLRMVGAQVSSVRMKKTVKFQTDVFKNGKKVKEKQREG